MRPELDLTKAAFVRHDRIATDYRIAAGALFRVRVEAPLSGTELDHGFAQYT
jgi:hypothetical protein